jgi:hypothetical protein
MHKRVVDVHLRLAEDELDLKNATPLGSDGINPIKCKLLQQL